MILTLRILLRRQNSWLRPRLARLKHSLRVRVRDSEYKGDFTYDAVLEIAQEGLGVDEQGYRKAFLEMVRKANSLVVAK